MGQPNGEGKGVSFRGRLWLVSKPDLSGAGLSNRVSQLALPLGREPGPETVVPCWGVLLLPSPGRRAGSEVKRRAERGLGLNLFK